MHECISLAAKMISFGNPQFLSYVAILKENVQNSVFQCILLYIELHFLSVCLSVCLSV